MPDVTFCKACGHSLRMHMDGKDSGCVGNNETCKCRAFIREMKNASSEGRS